MAYCKYCGTNNSESAKYCTNCGAPILAARTQDPYDRPRMQEDSYSTARMQQDPREAQRSVQRQQWEEENVQSQGHWVLDTFLVCIPLVGLILLIIWSVTDQQDLSKQRWARASLLWMIIGVVVSTVVVFLFGALLAGLGAVYF